MRLSILKPLIAMGASLLMCVGLFLTHSLDVNAHIKHKQNIEFSHLESLDEAHIVVDGKQVLLRELSVGDQKRIQAAAAELRALNELYAKRTSRLENKLEALEHSINLFEEKSLHWSVFLNDQSLHLTEQEFEKLNKALETNVKAIKMAASEIGKTLDQMQQKSTHHHSSTESIANQHKKLTRLLAEIAENS